MIRSAPSTDGSGPPLSATDPLRGLSEEEAERRRASGLGNEYRPPTSRGWWEILRQNAYLGINGPLIVISILLLLASRPIDAFLTAGPVLFNIGLGVYQEARAKQQLDRIALLNRPRATVVRDGVPRTIDPAELVLGDLIVAERGDQLLVEVLIEGSKRGIWKFGCMARVGEHLVAEANILCTVRPAGEGA